jgi:GGDEF domain-containing protein
MAALVTAAILGTNWLPFAAHDHGAWPGALFLALVMVLGVLQPAPWITVGVGLLVGVVQAGLIPTLTSPDTSGPQFYWPAFVFFVGAGCLAELAGRIGIRIERSVALGNAGFRLIDRRRPLPEQALASEESSLSRELARARRYHFNLAFVMLEIEDWQALIEKRGRAAMVERLGEVMSQIRTHIRPTDELAYMGSGRCALVLPYTDLSGAHVVLRRVQELLLSDSGLRTRVGVAEFPEDAESEESLISEAEAALEVAPENHLEHALPRAKIP